MDKGTWVGSYGHTKSSNRVIPAIVAGRKWANGIVFSIIKLIPFVVLLAFMAGIILVALAKNEKGVQYPFNRTVGLRKIYHNVLQPFGLQGTAICACQPDQVDTLVLKDQFETEVWIYDHGGAGPRPGVVLIHGNVWMGQQMSAYRIVAHRLAELGFIVLTFDKVGFGSSDDPFGFGPSAVAAAYDRVGQVEQAVDYLIENTDVDPSRITLLGHSGGVTQALQVSQKSDRIANVAIWVAPWAPATEGEVSQNQTYLGNKFEARYELLYGRKIPSWFSWDLAAIQVEDPDAIWAYFRKEDHKPLILILGEDDQPENHPYVLETFDSLAEPKHLVVAPGADHYLNSAQSLRWVFYDRSAAEALVDGLVTSLDASKN